VITNEGGFSIYDPQQDAFHNDPAKYLASIEMKRDEIDHVVRDRNGNYWFVHRNGGIFVLKKNNVHFWIRNHPGDSGTISSSPVKVLFKVVTVAIG